MKTPLPGHQRCPEHPALERLFLACVPARIALISLGFLVATFSTWLHDLVVRLDPPMPLPAMGMSLVIGLGMLACRGLLTVLTVWYCSAVYQANTRPEVRVDRNLLVSVTVGLALLAVVRIVYMLPTSRSQSCWTMSH